MTSYLSSLIVHRAMTRAAFLSDDSLCVRYPHYEHRVLQTRILEEMVSSISDAMSQEDLS